MARYESHKHTRMSDGLRRFCKFLFEGHTRNSPGRGLPDFTSDGAQHAQACKACECLPCCSALGTFAMM